MSEVAKPKSCRLIATAWRSQREGSDFSPHSSAGIGQSRRCQIGWRRRERDADRLRSLIPGLSDPSGQPDIPTLGVFVRGAKQNDNRAPVPLHRYGANTLRLAADLRNWRLVCSSRSFDIGVAGSNTPTQGVIPPETFLGALRLVALATAAVITMALQSALERNPATFPDLGPASERWRALFLVSAAELRSTPRPPA